MRTEDYAGAFESGYGATRRFLLSRGAQVEEAEEIAQAAWARGWEYRDQLRDPGLVGFWVNSIARNLLRARFRKPLASSLEDFNPSTNPSYTNPSYTNPSYTMDLAAIDLRRLLEGCPRRDRALLEQSLEGYSAEEIARTAGITSTGIRVRLLRIRQSLRQRLATAAA